MKTWRVTIDFVDEDTGGDDWAVYEVVANNEDDAGAEAAKRFDAEYLEEIMAMTVREV